MPAVGLYPVSGAALGVREFCIIEDFNCDESRKRRTSGGTGREDRSLSRILSQAVAATAPFEVIKKKTQTESSEEEETELETTSEDLEKTNDPVRMYLREMGTVPLLTREGEVEIAKRIEKGKRTVLK